jgi:hypothetical protein
VVTVLLVTGFAAAGWTFAVTVIPPGALSTLAAPHSRLVNLSGVVDGGQAAADSRLIRTTLRKAWPGVGFQLESALWANPIVLSSSSATTGPGPGFMRSSTDETSTQVAPAALEDFSAQATLTAGKWPGPPRTGGPVPVALPAAVAGALHVRLGSVLKGSPASSNATVSLLVTGLYRPDDPASPYWGLDLLPRRGATSRTAACSAEPATARSPSSATAPR